MEKINFHLNAIKNGLKLFIQEKSNENVLFFYFKIEINLDKEVTFQEQLFKGINLNTTSHTIDHDILLELLTNIENAYLFIILRIKGLTLILNMIVYLEYIIY